MSFSNSNSALVELQIFSALGSTAGSIADTDRGTDEELDDFNEEEEQESFSALYRLVNEESPPPEMPQLKKNFSCISLQNQFHVHQHYSF